MTQINTPIMTDMKSSPPYNIQMANEIDNLGNLQYDIFNVPPLNMLNSFENSQDPIPVKNLTNIGHNLNIVDKEEKLCVFEIVHPQDLNLIPAAKRGRPKKKVDENLPEGKLKLSPKTVMATNSAKVSRTRSGRLVKLPKYIEKDFQKIDISSDNQDFQVSDFKRFDEKENSKANFASAHAKRRVVAAQYKCPKCGKAYIGKNKMIQHLKRYPDHGPLPEGLQEFNFDVWNHLFDITQKAKPGQRGVKFCEELSNLLHNVQLLKSALFKTVTDNKNCVQIDKVLGNAIGLTPGRYKFDENELYKDVTIFKLISNTEFFKPNFNNNGVASKAIMQQESEHLEPSQSKIPRQDIQTMNEAFIVLDTEVDASVLISTKRIATDFNYISKSSNNLPLKLDTVCDQHFVKKIDGVDTPMLHSDLLSDNLLLHSLPHQRSSVEDLMLTTVDNGSNLLDNSTSSDEVMNVDQFVNERFKKIIEPDIELHNSSLNLDLPSLDLFQFHT